MGCLSGCMSTIPYSYRNYDIGKIDSCNVGNPIISIQEGVRDKLLNNFYGNERELIYTGISNNTISLMYREYYSNPNGTFIRPAFSMPLQYDLNSSTDITFKEFSIEVVDASTKQIIYRILQDSQLGRKGKKFVKVVFNSGVEYELFLIGESNDKYIFAKSLSDTSSSSVFKKIVKSITPIR